MSEGFDRNPFRKDETRCADAESVLCRYTNITNNQRGPVRATRKDVAMLTLVYPRLPVGSSRRFGQAVPVRNIGI